jgi:hypothetical protein
VIYFPQNTRTDLILNQRAEIDFTVMWSNTLGSITAVRILFISTVDAKAYLVATTCQK